MAKQINPKTLERIKKRRESDSPYSSSAPKRKYKPPVIKECNRCGRCSTKICNLLTYMFCEHNKIIDID